MCSHRCPAQSCRTRAAAAPAHWPTRTALELREEKSSVHTQLTRTPKWEELICGTRRNSCRKRSASRERDFTEGREAGGAHRLRRCAQSEGLSWLSPVPKNYSTNCSSKLSPTPVVLHTVYGCEQHRRRVYPGGWMDVPGAGWEAAAQIAAPLRLHLLPCPDTRQPPNTHTHTHTHSNLQAEQKPKHTDYTVGVNCL